MLAVFQHVQGVQPWLLLIVLNLVIVDRLVPLTLLLTHPDEDDQRALEGESLDDGSYLYDVCVC